MESEIRARLVADDEPEAILQGFVERYGPEVRAVSSPGSSNRLGAALLGAGVLAALGGGGDAALWDERLDRELDALDR